MPTVFDGVTNEMRIAREEIFGPVVSVIPFDTEEEALRLAMAHGFLLYIAIGKIVHGATLVAQEQVQDGLMHIRQGVTACPTLGTRQLQPWGLAMVAEQQTNTGLDP